MPRPDKHLRLSLFPSLRGYLELLRHGPSAVTAAEKLHRPSSFSLREYRRQSRRSRLSLALGKWRALQRSRGLICPPINTDNASFFVLILFRRSLHRSLGVFRRLISGGFFNVVRGKPLRLSSRLISGRTREVFGRSPRYDRPRRNPLASRFDPKGLARCRTLVLRFCRPSCRYRLPPISCKPSNGSAR